MFSRAGAAITETEIVFGRAALIAVTFDSNNKGRIETKNALQSGGIGLQYRLILRTDVALIVIKMDVLHLSGKHLGGSFAGGPRNRFGSRRRADGDGRGSITGAA